MATMQRLYIAHAKYSLWVKKLNILKRADPRGWPLNRGSTVLLITKPSICDHVITFQSHLKTVIVSYEDNSNNWVRMEDDG